MANFFLLLALFSSSYLYAQTPTPVKRTIKIRKKKKVIPFEYALSLPSTATSCDCPSNSSNTLTKLGCQHPDTAAICKVVVTQFDMAILPPKGAPIVLKDIKGSFLTEHSLELLQRYQYTGAFVSYSNIKGVTADGKNVVVPPFGSVATQRRAQREYRSIYNFLPTIDSSHTTIRSFELLAYDQYGHMLFKQTYDKDSFDVNAVRPDAARYVFQQIRAQHNSGFYVEVRAIAYNSLETPSLDLLSKSE